MITTISPEVNAFYLKEDQETTILKMIIEDVVESLKVGTHLKEYSGDLDKHAEFLNGIDFEDRFDELQKKLEYYQEEVAKCQEQADGIDTKIQTTTNELMKQKAVIEAKIADLNAKIEELTAGDQGAGGAGPYAIGDSHPDGGIVFEVDATGMVGRMVYPTDLGRIVYGDLSNALSNIGEGWSIPNLNDLLLVHNALHTAGIGNFLEERYWTIQKVSAGYAATVNFKFGRQENEFIGKAVLTRPIKSFG